MNLGGNGGWNTVVCLPHSQLCVSLSLYHLFSPSGMTKEIISGTGNVEMVQNDFKIIVIPKACVSSVNQDACCSLQDRC